MKKKTQVYLFLAALLSLIIIDQIVTSNMLRGQKADGTIINYAGRQRMLSQNIAKNIMAIQNKEIDNAATGEERRNLNQLLKDFTKSHNGLRERDEILNFSSMNSKTVQAMFSDIQPSYEVIVENTGRLLNSSSIGDIKMFSSTIMNNEQAFLTRMDTIVFQYNKEYNEKLDTVSTIILVLAFLKVCLLLFGVSYIGNFFKEK